MTMLPADCAAVTRAPEAAPPSRSEKFLRIRSVVTMSWRCRRSSPSGSAATRAACRCSHGAPICF